MDVRSGEEINKLYLSKDDEDQIRELIHRVSDAVTRRDIEGIMLAYAPNVTVYDVRDSLRIGRSGLRAAWKECFESSNSFSYQIKDAVVKVEGNLAVAHGLSHATGTTKKDEPIDVWMRWTASFCKVSGMWLVSHEHVSVPGNFSSGKVLTDLKPDEEFAH